MQKDLSSLYRTEGRTVLIELELNTFSQFFNTLDPSPFYEKDIDPDAEEYIVDAAREIHLHQPIKVVLYLPPTEAAKEDAEQVAEAMHHYFAYRARAARRELRHLFRQGRLSLTIGLAFLAFCVVARSLLPLLFRTQPVALDFIQEGLVISGWVAMWRPFQIFLYDWWPIRRRIAVLRKLSAVTIEIRARRQPAAAPAPVSAGVPD